MALYIVMQDETERSWHVGNKPIMDWYEVQHIQADGHELEHIQNKYRMDSPIGHVPYSIPMPRNQRVVIWYGDYAKIIVANL